MCLSPPFSISGIPRWSLFKNVREDPGPRGIPVDLVRPKKRIVDGAYVVHTIVAPGHDPGHHDLVMEVSHDPS